uniref:rRNA adenine N(6)-methyltransferase n=1 Tax=Panagrolaimus superbus TaxID=310955 RepID=A0A914ZCZ0_9BILA
MTAATSTFSKLPPLPALRDFIHMYRLKAKKILSQNYLMDMNLTRKIARKANFDSNTHVIEVGPGPGGITRAILDEGCARLDVVEIDHRFIPPLEHLAEAADGRLHIHRGDVLKTDLATIFKDAKIVQQKEWFDFSPNSHIIGNLPFNIASPLIIKFLREMSREEGPWQFGRTPLTLTFQLEVAQRLCGEIDSEHRSRLSIVTQYICEPKILFVIPGVCFVPKPEIDVGVVKFIPRAEPLIPCDFAVVEKVARQTFTFRQKYVSKCIKTLYPTEIADEMAHDLLKNCRIDPTQRPFKLGIDEIGAMCVFYEKQCQKMPGLFLHEVFKKNQTIEMLANEPNALPPTFKKLKGGISYSSFEDGIPLSKLSN